MGATLLTVLKGRVIREGTPVDGAYVRLIGPAGEFVNEQRTLEEGAFIFHLAPGAWTLDWTAPGRTGSQKTVELADGQVAELDLEIS